ncbi:MAG: hypothetical protein K2I16_06750, partial [Muribaculaceae bacterium]|nr:hypothetical protein [Muribaculaceae bacterium]
WTGYELPVSPDGGKHKKNADEQKPAGNNQVFHRSIKKRHFHNTNLAKKTDFETLERKIFSTSGVDGS